jgi:gliding motility-associated-like protein
MWRIGVLILVILVGSIVTSAQVGCDFPGSYCMQNGIFTTCEGTVSDDGGGNPYSDTPYTMTICPDTPGDVIKLSFNSFLLQTSPNPNNSDYLIIFDGNSTAANSLGSYTGTDLFSINVVGTVNNTTGCITLVFDPNGPANAGSSGFSATISCTTPCANPTAASEILDPMPVGSEQTVNVCLNSSVTFSDNGSFAEPGFGLTQFLWNFDDGTVDSTSGPSASHSFTEPGEYLVTLAVEDNNGCNSLNIIPLQIIVSTVPLFTGISQINPTQFCLGDELSMDAGQVENVTWTSLPPVVYSGQTFLDDAPGQDFSSTIIFDFFDTDAVLEDCAFLLDIFVNMEHSYMGDLSVYITCPDGTSVDLVTYPSGGSSTELGVPIDIDGNNNPGVGWLYWWTPTSNNGTWGDNADPGNSLPSDDYEAVGNLCDLVGCPLNGAWTLHVVDNIAIDNGYIFEWGVNFDASIYPGVTTFTPTIGTSTDSSYWSGPGILDISGDGDVISIQPPSDGVYEYTYTVVNSFGCIIDTTFTLVVEPLAEITAGEDFDFLCVPTPLHGEFLNGFVPQYPYEWHWLPALGLSNANIASPTLNSLTQTNTYTLNAYPIGHPNCLSTDEITISFSSNLAISVQNEYNICAGDSLHVNAPDISGGTEPYQFHWETEFGEVFNTLEFDYTPFTGSTQICGILEDQCGIVDSACGVILHYPVIPANFTMQDYLGCEPSNVLMTLDYTEYQNIKQMSWHFDDGDQGTTEASINHDYLNDGTYFPWLVITDYHDCIYIDTTETPVLIWPTPFANFEAAPSVNLLPNTTFAFSDLSIDASQYQWTFDAYGQGTAADTSFAFPAEMAASYLVGLKVSNQYGCSDSTYRQVIVEDEIDVYIPNSFTPDGDGINDFWFIDGKGFQELGYHMQVFNRWGDLVFESTDTTQPWTGSSQNGNHYVPDGVYTYLAKFRDNQNDVNYTYKGYVVVLR